MNKVLQKIIKTIELGLVLALLAGCGGGGYGGDDGGTQPPQGSNNWDQMVWDQDNWA